MGTLGEGQEADRVMRERKDQQMGPQARSVPSDTGVGCEDRAGGSEQGRGSKKAGVRLDGTHNLVAWGRPSPL